MVACAPQYYNPYNTHDPYNQYRTPYSPFRTYTPSPLISITPSPIVPVTAAPILPVAPVARVYTVPSAESQAPILRQDQDVNEDGSYHYG